jgi:hypothetical protein
MPSAPSFQASVAAPAPTAMPAKNNRKKKKNVAPAGPPFVPLPVSLQYADDTILFMEHDLEKAQNLKLILSAFEQLSGLKINFHKIELFCFGEAQDEVNAYANLFGCG